MVSPWIGESLEMIAAMTEDRDKVFRIPASSGVFFPLRVTILDRILSTLGLENNNIELY